MHEIARFEKMLKNVSKQEIPVESRGTLQRLERGRYKNALACQSSYGNVLKNDEQYAIISQNSG